MVIPTIAPIGSEEPGEAEDELQVDSHLQEVLEFGSDEAPEDEELDEQVEVQLQVDIEYEDEFEVEFEVTCTFNDCGEGSGESSRCHEF